MVYDLFRDGIADILRLVSGPRRDRGTRLKMTPASLSYDEVKDYLSVTGCRPCPSAEETKRKFENYLRSLPGCTSTHTTTTTTTTTPQPKDNSMFDSMFNGICGRIKPGNCRLSYTGGDDEQERAMKTELVK